MKNSFTLLVLVSGLLLTSVHATTKPEYQTATVVSVESRAIPSPYVGNGPSDAPLLSEVYGYDIDIRLGGTVYRTSYESTSADLPPVLVANHSVEVSLKRHVMCVELPGDQPVRLAIESRTGVNDVSRTARN
jgi:hypothetical protein